jgi:hypothetical protein
VRAGKVDEAEEALDPATAAAESKPAT